MNSRGVQIRGCICTRIVYGGASKVKKEKRRVFWGPCFPLSSSVFFRAQTERERERDLRWCVRFALGFFFPFFLCACLPAAVLHQNVKRHDVSCCCCNGEEGDKNKSSSTSFFFFFFFFFCSVSSFLFLVFFLFRSRLLCVVDCEQQYASAVVCGACLESWVPDVLSSLSSQCKGCISNEDRNLGGGVCDVQ
jgi:hypothetical protein